MYVNPLHYQGYTICMLTLYPLHYHGCTICMLTLYPLHYHGYTICMLTLYPLHYHGYTICMLTLYPLHYQGYTIPAGDILMLCPYLSHRNPESFPEPEKFNPVGHLTLVSSPPGMRHMGQSVPTQYGAKEYSLVQVFATGLNMSGFQSMQDCFFGEAVGGRM